MYFERLNSGMPLSETIGCTVMLALCIFCVSISHTSTQYTDFVDFLHFNGSVYQLFRSF